MLVLGFGTLIPDAAATISATRDALEAGFRHLVVALYQMLTAVLAPVCCRLCRGCRRESFGVGPLPHRASAYRAC